MNENEVARDLQTRASMKLHGFVAPAVILTGLIAACSADDGTTVITVPASSSTSSGYSAGKSGKTGYGSSGYDDGPYGYGTSGYGSTSGYGGTSGKVSPPGGTVDLASILSITASSDSCLKPPGLCADAEAFTVDFQKSTLTDTTCIELAGDAGAGQTQNVDQTKALSKGELDTVKARIAALSKVPAPPTQYDGPVKFLTITTTSGTLRYTPEAGCGDTSNVTWLDSQSWNDLWDTLRAL